MNRPIDEREVELFHFINRQLNAKQRKVWNTLRLDLWLAGDWCRDGCRATSDDFRIKHANELMDIINSIPILER